MVAESDLTSVVCHHYRSKGLLVDTEVPMLSKRIDVAAYDSSSDDLILIEVKVSDWMSALRQASIYTICTPNVYIAISRKYSHRVNETLVRDIGIGVLEIDGRVHNTIEPSISVVPQPSVRELVVSYIKSSEGGHL